MTAYYNDIDPFCCRVLRGQVAAGNLPPGDVDERDVRDVRAGELAGYAQVHLFAGLGGIPLGFRRAGVPDDFPVCTGGFPCKQTSTGAAVHGRRSGLDGPDSGLWQEQRRILAALRPTWAVVENVAGVATWSREITRRLEEIGYCVSRLPISAGRLGAPHRRRRLFFAANLDGKGLSLPWKAGSSAAERESRGAVAGDPWLSTLPRTVRMAPGVPRGLDRHRRERIVALGNAVMPAMGEWVGRRILEAEGRCGPVAPG